jgi:hypothetical protein
MEYFAGLDVSMEETHICILDREGLLIREGKASSTPKAIAVFLADGPICTKVVIETGRMAPMLFHGLTELGVPALHRKPPSLSGSEVPGGAQNRSKRRAWPGAFGADRVL